MKLYAKELRKLVAGSVLDDKETLQRFSADASVFEMRPAVVVQPRDKTDLSKLINFVTSRRERGEDISLTASSARTDMSGGPLSKSIIVDFLPHFNKLGEVVMSSRQAAAIAVEPGVYYRDFERKTLECGFILPSYPASKELCTLGGMVANNSGGELTLRYGKTERYVESLKVVFADGNEYSVRPLHLEELDEVCRRKTFEGLVYRELCTLIEQNREEIERARPKVTKNSAGYALWNVFHDGVFDLTQLICGSQGTLGFITEANLRLVRKPAYDRLVAVFLHDISLLSSIIPAILKHKPENFESYDDNTLTLALRYLPEIVRFMKPRNALALGLQFLPELWMVLKHLRMPKLVLLVQFAGDKAKEVDARVNRVVSALRAYPCDMRVTRSDEEERKYWTIRRESFNLLRKHLAGKHTAPFIDDFVVRPEFLPEFLPKLNQLLQRYHLTYTIAGHVGDGNFHIIPLMDFKDSRTAKVIKTLSQEVYGLVLSFQGSITGEHNDGLIRTPFLKQMYGDSVVELFERVKNIFDPKGIFNPYKKVRCDLDYAFRHIKRF